MKKVKVVFSNDNGVFILIGFPEGFYHDKRYNTFACNFRELKTQLVHTLLLRNVIRWEDLENSI